MLEGRPVYVAIDDADSNLEAVGFEKTRRVGDRLPLMFRIRGFHENRLPFAVRIRNLKSAPTARLTLSSSGRRADGSGEQIDDGSRQTRHVDVRLPDWTGVTIDTEVHDVVERKMVARQHQEKPSPRKGMV